jgi:hypothetical protein
MLVTGLATVTPLFASDNPKLAPLAGVIVTVAAIAEVEGVTRTFVIR